MSVDYRVVGNRIKSLRKEKEFTQEQLSKKMKVSVTFLSRIERGITNISLKRLTEVGEILNIPISYILTGSMETSDNYLIADFNEILQKCTPKKQKVILEMARMVSKI